MFGEYLQKLLTDRTDIQNWLAGVEKVFKTLTADLT